MEQGKRFEVFGTWTKTETVFAIDHKSLWWGFGRLLFAASELFLLRLVFGQVSFFFFLRQSRYLLLIVKCSFECWIGNSYLPGNSG